MHEEIFDRWVKAHAEGDTDALAACMAEGFVFEQRGLPKQLDKQEYLALVEELHHAFPDLELQVGTERVDPDGLVEWEQGLSATHEQDLDLTRLGLSFFLSTGNEVDLSAEHARTRIQDGRIVEHAIDDPSAGIAGLLDEVQTGLDAIREEAEQHDPKAPGL